MDEGKASAGRHKMMGLAGTRRAPALVRVSAQSKRPHAILHQNHERDAVLERLHLLERPEAPHVPVQPDAFKQSIKVAHFARSRV